MVNDLLDQIKDKFDKKNTSIMFTTPVDYKGEIDMEYEALYVIVNKENADKVIEISQKKEQKAQLLFMAEDLEFKKICVFKYDYRAWKRYCHNAYKRKFQRK